MNAIAWEKMFIPVRKRVIIKNIYKKKKNTFVDGIDVNYGEKVHIVFPSIDAKEKYYIKLTKGDTGTYAKGTIFLS